MLGKSPLRLNRLSVVFAAARYTLSFNVGVGSLIMSEASPAQSRSRQAERAENDQTHNILNDLVGRK